MVAITSTDEGMRIQKGLVNGFEFEAAATNDDRYMIVTFYSEGKEVGRYSTDGKRNGLRCLNDYKDKITKAATETHSDSFHDNGTIHNSYQEYFFGRFCAIGEEAEKLHEAKKRLQRFKHAHKLEKSQGMAPEIGRRYVG